MWTKLNKIGTSPHTSQAQLQTDRKKHFFLQESKLNDHLLSSHFQFHFFWCTDFPSRFQARYKNETEKRKFTAFFSQKESRTLPRKFKGLAPISFKHLRWKQDNITKDTLGRNSFFPVANIFGPSFSISNWNKGQHPKEITLPKLQLEFNTQKRGRERLWKQIGNKAAEKNIRKSVRDHTLRVNADKIYLCLKKS